MANYLVTKMFHRDTEHFRKGESFTQMGFFGAMSFDEVRDLLHSHNNDHERSSYHFTGFHNLTPDGRYAADFCMFDISEIWDAHDLNGTHMRDRRSWEPGAYRFNRQLNELLRTLSGWARRGRDISPIRAKIEALYAEAA